MEIIIRVKPFDHVITFSEVIGQVCMVSAVNIAGIGSRTLILGIPGATSRDDAIFSGKSLLQELKSPWELILTEPVPEVVEFHSADRAEKYAQSARSSSRVTLSLSYTKQFSSSIDLVTWLVQREGCRGEFQKKNIQRSRGDCKPYHGG